jgi:hypothetical protein
MRYRLLAVAVFGVLMFAGGWYLGHRAPVTAGLAIPALPAQAAPPLQEIIPFPGRVRTRARVRDNRDRASVNRSSSSTFRDASIA